MVDGLRSTRVIVLVAVCALAAVGVAVAYEVSGGPGSRNAMLPTTGQYAALRITSVPSPSNANAPGVYRPPIIMIQGAALNGSDASTQPDLTANLYALPGARHYGLTVTNSSTIGYINAFEWYPPAGVEIVKLTANGSGHCRATGLTGFGGSQFKSVLAFPDILCRGLDMKPPNCTCEGDGGSITVSFYLSEPAAQAGEVTLVSATPVLKPIPDQLSNP